MADEERLTATDFKIRTGPPGQGWGDPAWTDSSYTDGGLEFSATITRLEMDEEGRMVEVSVTEEH